MTRNQTQGILGIKTNLAWIHMQQFRTDGRWTTAPRQYVYSPAVCLPDKVKQSYKRRDFTAKNDDGGRTPKQALLTFCA